MKRYVQTTPGCHTVITEPLQALYVPADFKPGEFALIRWDDFAVLQLWPTLNTAKRMLRCSVGWDEQGNPLGYVSAELHPEFGWTVLYNPRPIVPQVPREPSETQRLLERGRSLRRSQGSGEWGDHGTGNSLIILP